MPPSSAQEGPRDDFRLLREMDFHDRRRVGEYPVGELADLGGDADGALERSGADDAAGLAVSEKMRAQIRGSSDNSFRKAVSLGSKSPITARSSATSPSSSAKLAKRRPARPFRLTYFTPDSTFPLCRGMYGLVGKITVP